MAIFTAGLAVGQISGRVAGSVYSHNRGGPYIRNGTIPVTSTTPAAIAAKTRLASVSQDWQDLSAAVRLAFRTWAQANPVTNRLGKSITLTGHQWFVALNTRLEQAEQTPIVVPPDQPAPTALASLTLSADIGPGTFDLTYTATPLDTDDMLRVFACVEESAGVRFVRNKLRIIGFSAAAAASPMDIEALIAAKFGAPQVGDVVHVAVDVLDTLTGLISPSLIDSAEVIDTTP